MYGAAADPYCYPGTIVLRNIPGLRDQAALDKFETASTAQRADEPLPSGRLSVAHYRALHHHLFQDVYSWAGKFRTVRIFKDGSAFCYPENIRREMSELFDALKARRGLRGLTADSFAREATAFLTTLNAIHPFREGNGRTQTAFLALIAAQAGHPVDLRKLEPEIFLKAMIASFHGDEKPLLRQIERLVA
ncbi:Fic family protein [Parvibaculum sp.]|uniref:Fic/DOC family protein n=1 Tax=Parvibaculum sp. TaxID=2024848 RepID=UPI00262EFBA3|nr:Fic family protein [Parvibaculum sp.]MCW5728359.1 Fic family protein [Parvibaculum sp.]